MGWTVSSRSSTTTPVQTSSCLLTFLTCWAAGVTLSVRLSPGLIQVWILLLEQLTAAVSNCPRQHQPPTLELLFALLREVANMPGNVSQDA